MSADRSRITDAIAENSPDLLAYFERRVGPDDAADLLAETMMTAWRRGGSIPPSPEEARMWLFGVARNVLANAERSERRRWRLADRLRLLLDPRPERDAADAGAEVRDAVARLEPDLAELVRLIHWDGFGVAEAGAVLGWNPSTARTRYARAKSDLKASLDVASAVHP